MIKLALAQITPQPSIEFTIDKIKDFSKKAKTEDAHLIVFPEMTMGVFDKEKTPYKLSQYLESFLEKLSYISINVDIDIICPVWEKDISSQKAYNSIAFIQKKDISILYRKIHLFDALGFNESLFVKKGDFLPKVINYRDFNISFSICYDLRFPELYRHQADIKTDISIVCSAWYSGTMKEEHLHTLLRARAIENTMYVVCANLCGDKFCGRSVAFDPFGVMLQDAGEAENILVVTCLKERIKEVRKKLPALLHRKDDIFSN